jgi:hypothetical protein
VCDAVVIPALYHGEFRAKAKTPPGTASWASKFHRLFARTDEVIE